MDIFNVDNPIMFLKDHISITTNITRYHCTLIRMAKIKKLIIQNSGDDVDKHCRWECITVKLEFLTKQNMHLSFKSATVLCAKTCI